VTQEVFTEKTQEECQGMDGEAGNRAGHSFRREKIKTLQEKKKNNPRGEGGSRPLARPPVKFSPQSRGRQKRGRGQESPRV